MTTHEPTPTRFDAVVFDLDGTLCDTLDDIAAVANHVLEQFGAPPHPREAYRYLAGQGARWLIEHALPEAMSDRVDEVLAAFKAYQREHAGRLAKPYDGVPEMLDALVARSLPIAVLSNKPDAATVELIGSMYARWPFQVVRGARDGVPLKPDAAAAFEVARELGVEPDRVMYVGDTRVDMETAKNAGFFALGVTWGFRDEPELRGSGADAIIHEPTGLLDVLQGGGRGS